MTAQNGTGVQALLAAAAEAKRQGDLKRASDLTSQALVEHKRTGEAVPRVIHYELGVLLYQQGRLGEAEAVVRAAREHKPKDFALANLQGVLLKNLGRFDEAIAALDAAAKLDPKNLSPIVNKGNIYIQLREGRKAIECFSRIVRQEPKSAEYHRLLGTAHRLVGEFDKAITRFETALKLNPAQPAVYRELAASFDEWGRSDDAMAVLQRGAAQLGSVQDIMETQVILLRRMGRRDDAEALLRKLVADSPRDVWIHLQLARTLAPVDRDRANQAFAAALQLDPQNPRILTEFADSLDRTRGPREPQNIAAGYELVLRRLPLGGNFKPDAKSLRSILIRSADYDRAAELGDFDELSHYWASTGEIAGLHHMMPQVRTPEQRRSLVRHHRTWGRRIEAIAEKSPIARPAIRPRRAKVRVGFMSSDLRDHPVAYFAIDLLTRYDRSRFEFYGYSWSTKPTDVIQERITAAMDGFRWKPHVGDRAAAQLIADDDLDILFELGGSTDMNKLDVMAWKPAPRQASWLGYPHSAGLAAIDRILVDPFINPQDPALLIEKPFLMPRTWVALDQPTFAALPDIDPVTPQERTGRVTFGTMNNPYKYSIDVVALWAEAVKAVPGSRFLFVRPEGAVPSFRENMEKRFESLGVARDRIAYVPVRGAHMPFYNEIDVALDTFPQTGGTTTCETLWMGVPAITLVGEAFYERLSYSNLCNAGLSDLCTFDKASYAAKAAGIASDTQWRTQLRRSMRERLCSHPLGNPEAFVVDFQDTLLQWMDEQP